MVVLLLMPELLQVQQHSLMQQQHAELHALRTGHLLLR
jgi:hypothetical protein